MRRRIPALTELSVRRMDKNVRSVFEQCKTLARLRASLMDEVSEPAAKAPGIGLRRLYAVTAGIRLNGALFSLQRPRLPSYVTHPKDN